MRDVRIDRLVPGDIVIYNGHLTTRIHVDNSIALVVERNTKYKDNDDWSDLLLIVDGKLREMFQVNRNVVKVLNDEDR